MIRIAALLTAHNRKAKTLACLDALFGQTGLPEQTLLQVYLVDDGSTDGTSTAVSEKFPKVKVLPGTGSLYWNGGMRLAFGVALRESFDYYMWINDDTLIFSTALGKLLETANQLKDNSIVVASIQDPETGRLTYGGVRRLHRCRPLKFTLVAPAGYPLPVETMNGNCVLIPRTVARQVGNLDPVFVHGIGDYDYGLRARQLGFEVYLAPGYYGYCQRNSPETLALSWQARWKLEFSPNRLPPRAWAVFSRRYGGLLWFVIWASPYLKALFGKRQ